MPRNLISFSNPSPLSAYPTLATNFCALTFHALQSFISSITHPSPPLPRPRAAGASPRGSAPRACSKRHCSFERRRVRGHHLPAKHKRARPAPLTDAGRLLLLEGGAEHVHAEQRVALDGRVLGVSLSLKPRQEPK